MYHLNERLMLILNLLCFKYIILKVMLFDTFMLIFDEIDAIKFTIIYTYFFYIIEIQRERVYVEKYADNLQRILISF